MPAAQTLSTCSWWRCPSCRGSQKGCEGPRGPFPSNTLNATSYLSSCVASNGVIFQGLVWPWMGFTSTSVILCPKRALEPVLPAQHNSSIRKLDLCFPVTHSSFSVHVPSILSLLSINHYFSRGLCGAFGPSHSVPFPPTWLKAARYLSCDSPGGSHHVPHGITSLCLASSASCSTAPSPLAAISELSLRAAASPAAGARFCLAFVSWCPGQR